MIDVDFKQQESRVVEITSEPADPEKDARHTLSGFLIADHLVLTCAHDVVGAGSLRARRPGDETESDAELLWPLPGEDDVDSDLLDVALLRVDRFEAPPGQRLVWGEHSGFVGAAEAYCLGFPRVASAKGRFHVAPVTGDFFPGEGASHQRMIFTATSARPTEASDWQGLSGAMVRDADGYLLGVVAKLPRHWDGRFFVVPSQAILARPRLRRLLGGPELHPISSEHPLIKPAHEPMGEETDLKLVTAKYGQVPFVAESHGQALDELTAWCDQGTGDGPDVRVRLVIGPGGSGKTRLATELCRRMQERGPTWLAGFAREDERAPWDSFQPQQPMLVVFDYMERPAVIAKVADFLRHLDGLGAKLQAPVRLLLVARTITNWYDQVEDLGKGLLSRRLRLDRDAATVELSPERFDRALRERHFVEAFRRFAGSNTVDGKSAEEHFAAIADDRYDSPLLIHIAALLAARGGVPVAAGGEGFETVLLDHLLRRERERRWRAETGLTTTAVGPERSDQALHVIAITTLTEPTANEAEELLKASKLWREESPAARRDAVRAAMRLYPGDRTGRAQRVAALEPDLVAEHLLANLEDLGDLLKELLRRKLNARHYARLLHILSLAGDHYPWTKVYFRRALKRLPNIAQNDGASAALIASVLRQALPQILATVVKQVVEDGDTGAAASLTRMLGKHLDDRRVNEIAANSDTSQCGTDPRLRDLRAVLHEHAVAHYRRIEDRESELAAREALLETLLEQGRSSEAYEAFTAALRLRRALGRDEAAVLRWGRGHFDRFAQVLIEQDRCEEALELVLQAVRGHRVLKAEGREAQTGRIEALERIAERLCERRRFDAAIRAASEALSLRRSIGDAEPRAYERPLRTLEASIAARRGRGGRRLREAVDLAVEIGGVLAEAAPERRREYAEALTGYAERVRREGDLATACEWLHRATGILRGLASGPESQGELAAALEREALASWRLRKEPSAPALIREAMTVRLRLPEAPDDASRVPVDEDAVEALREMAEADPAVRPRLAEALHELGGRRLDETRTLEARRLLEEAAGLYRSMPAEWQARFGLSYARTLVSLVRWHDEHRPSEPHTREMAKQAVATCRRLRGQGVPVDRELAAVSEVLRGIEDRRVAVQGNASKAPPPSQRPSGPVGFEAGRPSPPAERRADGRRTAREPSPWIRGLLLLVPVVSLVLWYAFLVYNRAQPRDVEGYIRGETELDWTPTVGSTILLAYFALSLAVLTWYAYDSSNTNLTVPVLILCVIPWCAGGIFIGIDSPVDDGLREPLMIGVIFGPPVTYVASVFALLTVLKEPRRPDR